MENRIVVSGIKQWVSQENMAVTAKGTGNRVILVVMEPFCILTVSMSITGCDTEL